MLLNGHHNPVLNRAVIHAGTPLYQRILDAGKSVQIVGVTLEEVIPLLDKIGGKGVYIMTSYADERSFETLLEKVEQYRG